MTALRLTLLSVVLSSIVGCEQDARPAPERVGTDLLKGHPRAERIIQRFGGADAYNLVQSATQVEAVRIGKIRDDLRVQDAQVKDYPVIAEGEAIDAELLWQLKHVFVNPRGGIKTCLPRYGLRLRFQDGKKQLDILLCYQCNLFGVFRDGRQIGSGAFDADRPELVGIAKQLFPKDELIKAMQPLGCGPAATPSDKKNPL